MRDLPCLLLIASLAGCAPWPDVTVPGAEAASRDGSPALVPLGPLLAQGAMVTPVPAPPDDRVAALRARAAALRGPVIDPATRDRMETGIDPDRLPPALPAG